MPTNSSSPSGNGGASWQVAGFSETSAKARPRKRGIGRNRESNIPFGNLFPGFLTEYALTNYPNSSQNPGNWLTNAAEPPAPRRAGAGALLAGIATSEVWSPAEPLRFPVVELENCRWPAEPPELREPSCWGSQLSIQVEAERSAAAVLPVESAFEGANFDSPPPMQEAGPVEEPPPTIFGRNESSPPSRPSRSSRWLRLDRDYSPPPPAESHFHQSPCRFRNTRRWLYPAP